MESYADPAGARRAGGDAGRTPRTLRPVDIAIVAEPEGPADLAPRASTLRSIIAALGAEGDGEPRLVLVTSALPGGRRTALSAELAVHASLAGRRAMVIDLDAERGRAVDADGRQRPSPAELLLAAGMASDDPAFRQAVIAVDLVASGRRREVLVTMLRSGRLRALLERLGGCYDLVVIDSPPDAAESDIRSLAPAVDKVLVATRPQRERPATLAPAPLSSQPVQIPSSPRHHRVPLPLGLPHLAAAFGVGLAIGCAVWAARDASAPLASLGHLGLGLLLVILGALVVARVARDRRAAGTGRP